MLFFVASVFHCATSRFSATCLYSTCDEEWRCRSSVASFPTQQNDAAPSTPSYAADVESTIRQRTDTTRHEQIRHRPLRLCRPGRVHALHDGGGYTYRRCSMLPTSYSPVLRFHAPVVFLRFASDQKKTMTHVAKRAWPKRVRVVSLEWESRLQLVWSNNVRSIAFKSTELFL